MYISQIHIKRFRNFKDHQVEFNDGINVIIGHNNSGKTNLLKALSLVIDYKGSKRLGIDDFNKGYTLQELKDRPPEVAISVTFMQSENEATNPEDLALVADWLVKLGNPYQAQLTYTFSLPEKHKDEYKKAVDHLPEQDEEAEKAEALVILQRDFLRKYVVKIIGGQPSLQQKADGEHLEKIDFQFLDAIRDVERDMFTGKNTLLREVIRFFLDYDVKNDSSLDEEKQRENIRSKNELFQKDSKALINQLLHRLKDGNTEILKYATQTGASSFNNAKPGFEGNVSEEDLFAALRLMIEHANLKIPATHNGLGYNNLIFISLLLAKMQVDSDGDYLDSNAKVFPVLAIEEPEAHLHPAMQYKFLKFLKNNTSDKVRQVFVSSHSTHITSAVSLDEIICLHSDGIDLKVAYPGKTFPNSDDGKKSKAYVQRFLDATKSEMLFAKKVIMVEGLAEQILLPILTEYSGKSLEDEHVAIVNIGGRYFDHFLHLFDTDGNPDTAIPKKVACITDRDPERKDTAGTKFKKCYPFEYDKDPTNYKYQNNGEALVTQYSAHPNIRFFTQDEKGKTFEYTLAWFNPKSNLIITDSISNRIELENLIVDYSSGESLSDLLSKLRISNENNRITDSLNASNWDEEDKKKALFAARYLNSVGKGENALELDYQLRENFEKDPANQKDFKVPTYLETAITWICQ